MLPQLIRPGFDPLIPDPAAYQLMPQLYRFGIAFFFVADADQMTFFIVHQRQVDRTG